MGTNLNPYLHFTDTAREAMEFYRDALGGELTMMTFGDAGVPGAPEDGVMHAQLETSDGLLLMGADTPPAMGTPGGGGQMTVSLSGDDGDRLRAAWEALSDGAEVHTPLARQMWGDDFGQLTDRYGVPWLVNIAGAAAE